MGTVQEETVGTTTLTAELHLPLGGAAATFKLDTAVCSHGLFMMAPNMWDPQSKTLQRPLRLCSGDRSATVRISQPDEKPEVLVVGVVLEGVGEGVISPQDQEVLLDQVRRMLRLSEEDEITVREFQQMYGDAKKSGFGRVFRSPTLFEDMVKCILLCNCQWPRTLSMAQALCELQYKMSVVEHDKSTGQTSENQPFSPKTPVKKETRKKIRVQQVKARTEADATVRVDCADISICLEEKQTEISISSYKQTSIKDGVESCSFTDLHFSDAKELHSFSKIGNFPSPEELASLDVDFLAKRCNLGYRASRILNLARSIVEGKVQLSQLEEDCGKACISNYSKLAEQLKAIDGFGPFTCANVLMCMGFYHVIPTDSETIRHLKQVHRKSTTIQNVVQDVESLYGKYKPYQFLVYWSEIWSFYEERFGKMSEMPKSQYKLITAAKMKSKKRGGSKRIKVS